MVCKSAQIPPEIWMTLPLEAKKRLLNERKRQQQADNKIKKSLALNNLQMYLITRTLTIPRCQINMQE
jgi:hypothetical protein